VGGFAMAAADSGQVNTTNLFASPRPIEGMIREGQAQICERADAEGIELAGCSVPLRVALIALDGQPAAVVDKTSPRGCASGLVEGGKRCAPKRCVADEDGGCTTSEPSGEPRPFDQSAVERVVRERQGAVRRNCWEAAADSVRRVNIAVTTTIDLRGRVVHADAQLLDSEGSADVAASVARCIGGQIMTWQFPEPETQKVLTLPFHLIRQ
jgi:hypothetical protein